MIGAVETLGPFFIPVVIEGQCQALHVGLGFRMIIDKANLVRTRE